MDLFPIYQATINGGTVRSGEVVWVWRKESRQPALVRKVFVHRSFKNENKKLVLGHIGYTRYEDSPAVSSFPLTELYLSEEAAILARPDLANKRESALLRAGRRQGRRKLRRKAA